MHFNFTNEILRPVTDQEAKYSNNLTQFHLIKKLRSEGRQVKPFLMKNQFVAYVIQTPVWRMYESGTISGIQLNAGLKFQADYLRSIKDNSCRQIYDVPGSAKPGNEKYEPRTGQIEAAKRVAEIKKILENESKYRQPIKGFKSFKSGKSSFKNSAEKDKQLKVIADLFLIEEKSQAQLRNFLNMSSETLKQRIIEILDIIAKYYA